MDAKRRSPLGLLRQWQGGSVLSSSPPNAPVRVAKRPSAQRRNLPPLPEPCGRGSPPRELDGSTLGPSTRKVSAGAKKVPDVRRTPNSLLRANKAGFAAGQKRFVGDGVTSPPSSAGVKPPGAGVTNGIKAKMRSGMRELKIARDNPNKAVASEQVPLVTGEPMAQKEEAVALCSKEQAEFENAIGVLNRMMEIDAKSVDPRAWVTRFTEGTAEARLRKEGLLPVWIIVDVGFVLAIDLNGTTQHRNYVGIAASRAARFPPNGCIVFPFQDALRDGEVQLPGNVSEVATMIMPAAKEMRWGVPVGVLFINPLERDSIVRDICQVFLPSFLQEAYPHGVPLKGIWAPAASERSTTTPRAMKIPGSVRESVMSCLTELGVSNASTFMGDGNRLGGEQLTRELQLREAVPPHLSLAGSLTGSRGGGSPRQPQKLVESPASMRGAPSSPWESRGRQPIFTARLIISKPLSPSTAGSVPCHAVLVLTPRGPLELVADAPSTAVSTKDVKLSLLRSGLGRSLRLQKDTVRFLYAPSLPAVDDDELINARYVVMRLQTQK
ncbi:uncharacterized protein Tco025E_09274 [Trypanosoma conorhini]|uniref:Uncharacterized protein n=1 Tax=Trypanosoma conorhini TaxID=83891 RepID=A0A3R7KD82_9TRYP|nr:uncharacterized protein Tco025E_09274 [Trypanosoma conorhini]RNE98172.1 hypothetical protein Tco025E_09274 [Trypanosoma conorhini]